MELLFMKLVDIVLFVINNLILKTCSFLLKCFSVSDSSLSRQCLFLQSSFFRSEQIKFHYCTCLSFLALNRRALFCCLLVWFAREASINEIILWDFIPIWNLLSFWNYLRGSLFWSHPFRPLCLLSKAWLLAMNKQKRLNSKGSVT